MLTVDRARTLLASLHPGVIREGRVIREILEKLRDQRLPLQRGVNRKIDPELAFLRSVGEQSIWLDVENIECRAAQVLLLNFQLDGRAYGMWVRSLEASEKHVVAEFPDSIYVKERRDRRRIPSGADPDAPRTVTLSLDGRVIARAEVCDFSGGGLSIRVPAHVAVPKRAPLSVRFLDGSRAGLTTAGILRHERPCEQIPGWKQIGLSTLLRGDNSIAVERRIRLAGGRIEALEQSLSFASASVRLASTRTLGRLLRRRSAPRDVQVPLVEYENSRGERIKAIIDSWGDARAATAVVIPPAWGRTKETLLPLAATIVESFKAARRPIVVVRFDGIRRRGESHNEAGCQQFGCEHHRFTFSQGVDDIRTTVTFLESSLGIQRGRTVLVTFSAASIDGRRAAAELGSRLAGWICVVGGADLQSMMRVVSGGIDLVAGVERGVRFGLTEILGVEVDIDLAGRDALAHRLAFLEDSCSDFSRITVPVTWLHGRYDAWMDLERIRTALSHGKTSNRRLLEIPTGHQLRNSREALGVFQLVAAEVGRLAGVRVRARLPKLDELEDRGRAERGRLPRRKVNKREFWRSYLLGRDGTLGIELMTSTSHYREFMDLQIETLALVPGSRVLDLGCGTGSFPLQLSRFHPESRAIRVVEVDYVFESLIRARSRLDRMDDKAPAVSFASVNVDRGKLPFGDGVFDAVLASLLLNYVDNIELLVSEVRRVLRPGGRFVISGMRKDADISRLFRDGLEELSTGAVELVFSSEEADDLSALARNFLNEAARLMDLEEAGVFEFFEGEQLTQVLREAGFAVTGARASFGKPPQALVISAIREPH